MSNKTQHNHSIILAVVGMCGTGKSVVTEYITRTYHFKSVYFGGFVLEEVKRRNLEINSDNEKNVREDLRKQHGLDVMAKLAVRSIISLMDSGNRVIIDGLYSFSEYLYLKEQFGEKLIILAIHTARPLRYLRLENRVTRPLTPHQVDERDLAEIKNIEKAGPIAIADYHIVNNGTIENLCHNLDEVIVSLKGLI